MLSRDALVENLISRLFAYAPRVGREALEDYCTEALAWCLSRSPRLLKKFLNLTDIPALRDRTDRADVQTQVRFSNSDSDSPEEDRVGGRFDLVIESGIKDPFVLVVETKIASDFGKSQLQMYRKRLDAPDAFEVPNRSRYLVTLTTLPYSSPLTHGSNIVWWQIHQLVDMGPGVDDPFVSGIFEQFTAFLKEKGLSMLELNKATGKLLDAWREGKVFEQQLKQILERLRIQDELKIIVGRKQVKPDGEWIGVSGKNGFWAGFSISKMKTGPELYMWVEITVPGDCRKRVANFNSQTKIGFDDAKRYLAHHKDYDAVNFNVVEGGTRFVFAKCVADELDGHGEAVFKWLYEVSKDAVKLAERGR